LTLTNASGLSSMQPSLAKQRTSACKRNISNMFTSGILYPHFKAPMTSLTSPVPCINHNRHSLNLPINLITQRIHRSPTMEPRLQTIIYQTKPLQMVRSPTIQPMPRQETPLLHQTKPQLIELSPTIKPQPRQVPLVLNQAETRRIERSPTTEPRQRQIPLVLNQAETRRMERSPTIHHRPRQELRVLHQLVIVDPQHQLLVLRHHRARHLKPTTQHLIRVQHFNLQLAHPVLKAVRQ